MKTPISVHALFHKDNSEGPRIYQELYKLLCRDIDNPFSDGFANSRGYSRLVRQ